MRAHRCELAEPRSLKDLSPSSTGGTWGEDVAGGHVGGPISEPSYRTITSILLGSWEEAVRDSNASIIPN